MFITVLLATATNNTVLLSTVAFLIVLQGTLEFHTSLYISLYCKVPYFTNLLCTPMQMRLWRAVRTGFWGRWTRKYLPAEIGGTELQLNQPWLNTEICTLHTKQSPVYIVYTLHWNLNTAHWSPIWITSLPSGKAQLKSKMDNKVGR